MGDVSVPRRSNLSDALARPVDRLVQNDDAAFATRAMLA